MRAMAVWVGAKEGNVGDGMFFFWGLYCTVGSVVWCLMGDG
jgi:hypothetical protein